MILFPYRSPRWGLTLAAAAVLAAAGCAGGSPISRDGDDCAAFLERLDAAADSDAQAARVTGFPYLRVNRFLASFRDAPLEDAAFDAWVTRMQHLDLNARRAEIANLAAPHRESLSPPPDLGNDLTAVVAVCGDRLKGRDLDDAERRQALRATARVPDSYRTLNRVAGLYPLSMLPVAAGVRHYHDRVHDAFRTSLSERDAGTVVRYLPPPGHPMDRPAVAAAIEQSRDAMGVPDPDEETRRRLFDTFAPAWDVEVATAADLMGAPAWTPDHKPRVDIARPNVYRHVSFTRFEGDVLLQLNYVVWFPARPQRHALDPLGGWLDGLIWRVTIDADGGPLVYDAVHSCGCYHRFFPTDRLVPQPGAGPFTEPGLVPQWAPHDRPGGLALRLKGGSHYIERVLPADRALPEATVIQRWADYDALRSLPSGEGESRSLFGPDGLIPGTQRGERWFLWPMGVPSAGAQRQWGHHATAFVGRRHFDDPALLDHLFQRAD